MNNLGIGLIVGGGFLFGIGLGHIVPVAGAISILGAILITAGLIVLFTGCRIKKKNKSKN
jgi:hypothetical protein